MPGLIIAVYAVAVYLLFLAVLGYAIGFFGDLGVPKGIGQGARTVVPAAAAISSTFLISHSDLFGSRQAWLHARRISYSPPPFTERGLYRRIRHPLMAGFVVIFWPAPAMTTGHLLFAAAATGYILVGIAFEEHDLIQSLGGTYSAYRARIPALIPHPDRRQAT